MSDLTHVDESGDVHMVDVGDKEPTDRRATARSTIRMAGSTADRVFDGDVDKGDVLATVRIAAISGTKRTADLIPLCHPLVIDAVDVAVERVDEGASVTVVVRSHGRTGVEMEAMTGAAAGALAMYDMVKGIDRGASIGEVTLLEKSGGRSGTWRRG